MSAEGHDVDPNLRHELADLLRDWTNGVKARRDFESELADYWNWDDGHEVIEYVVELMPIRFEPGTDAASIKINRERWNFIQRLILLLESGYGIQYSSSRRWNTPQIPAIATTMGLLYWGMDFDLYDLWKIACVPLTLLASVFHKLRQLYVEHQQFDPVHTPFRSIADIEDAIRRTPGFCKTRFPGVESDFLANQKICSDSPSVAQMSIQWLTVAILWFAFSPLTLLVQCLPVYSASTFACKPR